MVNFSNPCRSLWRLWDRAAPAHKVLFYALILSIIVSIPLSVIPVMDFAQTEFKSGNAILNWNSQALPVTQIRFGIWSACVYDSKGHRTQCFTTAFPYNRVKITTENTADYAVVPSSTPLVVHPIATAVTFLALLLSLRLEYCDRGGNERDSEETTMFKVVVIFSYIVLWFTTITLVFDGLLFKNVSDAMARLGEGVETKIGLWFWLVNGASLIPSVVLIKNVMFYIEGDIAEQRDLRFRTQSSNTSSTN